ncbi:MAG: hypothetical protein FJX59_17330 [Alphaproteobacteria bacterium]|nr:hypothetical protein [Alphaproteobacteria bacterium]
MSLMSAARALIALAAMPTLVIMLFAAVPWNSAQPLDLIVMLFLFPFVAAWAIAPYVMAGKLAGDCEGAEGWWLVAAIPIVAAPVIWIYLEAFVFADTLDAQVGLVFAIFPLYQAVAVLAVYGAILGLRWLKAQRQ